MTKPLSPSSHEAVSQTKPSAPPNTPFKPNAQRWFSIRSVAAVIGYAPVPLRRLIERHARKGPDGTIESVVDGLRARKLGRTWRVQLGERWLS